MKKGYNLKDLMISMKGNNVSSFINDQALRFTERFGLAFEECVSVTLKFESSQDANDFYNELKFNSHYAKDYTVTTSNRGSYYLTVTGAETLYDYFGSTEPNLLTVSRDLGLNFEIYFTQTYTGTEFTGAVHRGELLSRQCIVEVSNIIPELTLGGLHQIARDEAEFNDLLTRCYLVEGQTIYE